VLTNNLNLNNKIMKKAVFAVLVLILISQQKLNSQTNYPWINLSFEDVDYTLTTLSNYSIQNDYLSIGSHENDVFEVYVYNENLDEYLCEDKSVERKNAFIYAQNKAKFLSLGLNFLQQSEIDDLGTFAYTKNIQKNSYGEISSEVVYYPSFYIEDEDEVENWGDNHVLNPIESNGIYHYSDRVDIYEEIIYALIIPEYGSQDPEDDEVFQRFEEEYDKFYGHIFDNAIVETINFLDENPQITLVSEALELFTDYYSDILQNEIVNMANQGVVVSSQWQHLSWATSLNDYLNNLGTVTGIVSIVNSAFQSSAKAFMVQAYSAGLAQQRLSSLKHIVSSGLYNENINGYDEAFIEALLNVDEEFSDYENEFWEEVMMDVLTNYEFWITVTEFGAAKIAGAIWGQAASIAAMKVMLPLYILKWSWDVVSNLNECVQHMSLAANIHFSMLQMINQNVNDYNSLLSQLYIQEWKKYLGYYYYGNYGSRMYDNGWIVDQLQWLNQLLSGGNWDDYQEVLGYIEDIENTKLNQYIDYHAPYFDLTDKFEGGAAAWMFGLLDCPTTTFVISLNNGNVTPTSGTTDDIFEFSVTYTDQSNNAPNDVRIYFSNSDYPMNANGSNFDQGVEYTKSFTFTAAGSVNYYFEAETSTGEILRYPENGFLSLNIGESSVGWEVWVSEVDASPNYLINGGNVGITAKVHNNSNSSDKVYTNLDYEFTLFSPVGNLLDSYSGSINQINQLQTVNVNTDFSIPSQPGSYTINFYIYPEKDSNFGNNSGSDVVIVGQDGPSHQFYISSDDAWLMMGDTPYQQCHLFNGNEYCVTHIQSDYIRISQDEGFPNKIYRNEFREYNSGQAAVILESVMNIPDWIAIVSFGVQNPNYVTFAQTQISCFPGDEISFAATCYQSEFSSTDPDFYENDYIEDWFEDVDVFNNGNSANFEFEIPNSASVGEHEFFMGSRLSNGNEYFLRELVINVITPSPIINSISSSSISADDVITISGNNFQNSGTVKFGNITALNISTWSDNSITCTVPEGIQNGNIIVINSGGASNGMPYQVISSTGDPELVQPIPDMSLQTNTTTTIANLNNVFWDPNGDELEFSIDYNSLNLSHNSDFNTTGILVITTSDQADVVDITITAEDADEATVSDQFTITIYSPQQPPIADAGGPYEAISIDGLPVAITLDGSSSYDPDGEIVSWEWNWDGGSASGATITESFPVGITEITLTVTDDESLVGTDVTNIKVMLEPEAIAGGPYEAVSSDGSNMTIILDGSGSSDPDGNIVNWLWEWPGGSITGETVEQDFPVGETFVTLTVTDNDGLTDQDETTVTVNQVPVADAGGPYEATADPTGFAEITLDGSGSTDEDGTIISWDWSWDGGSTSGETVDQDFPEGNTEVTLTVTDDDGLTDTDLVIVMIEECPLMAPVANSGGPYDAVVSEGENAEIELSGIGSDDPDGTIVSWEWTWAGGSASGETVSHEFPAGITEVTLTVTDNDDLTDSDQTTVTVLVTPVANAAGPYEAVVSEGENAEILLDGSASYDPDGAIISWDWTWAGGSATGETVTQEFPEGITEVTLTVTDNDDLTDDAQTTVKVLVKPIADAGAPYEAVVSEGENAEILLDGSASYDPDGAIVSWDWTWAGGSASGETVSHEFPAGITEVTLTVTDNDNLTDSDQTTVTVLVTPVANAAGPYEAVVSEGENAEILLDGSASYDPDGAIISWDWTWAGGSATGETVTQEFPAGITEVTLTVTDNDDLTDDAQTTVKVLVKPVADAGGPNEADANYDQVATILLDGQASYDPDGTILSWEWNWDGGSASGETAEVEFSSGDYVVTLTVTDDDGNQHAAETTVTINEYIYTAPEVTILYPEEGYLYEYTIISNGTATDVDDDITEVLIRLNGDEWMPVSGIEVWTTELDLEIGENLIEVKAIDAQSLESDVVNVGVILSIQQITIPEGWSAISSYLNPNDPDVEVMFQDIVSENNLTMLLSHNGFYWPGQNINIIGEWNSLVGYKIKMTNEDLLEIKGPPVEGHTLELEAGLHYIPVLTNQTVGINEVFSDPLNDINYIFDIVSNAVYWPFGGLFTLNEFVPGLGYLASLSNPVVLTFPEIDGGFNSNYKSVVYNYDDILWDVNKSPDFHLIALQSSALSGFDVNDIIGVFDAENQCIGATRITNTNTNHLLTVFADDPSTEGKDGAIEGEYLNFVRFNQQMVNEEIVHPVWNKNFSHFDGDFVVRGTSGITEFKSESLGVVNQQFSEITVNIVPNPARDAFYLNINTEIADACELNIFNIKGQLVKELSIKESSTKVNIENLPEGVYIINVKISEVSITRRLIKE
jgi:hypothetical protein